ncbi:MAG: hypothetical protein A4E57_04029 [Syntrophorhabdaceae bacterium PtaU1.Bin034]|nr:MAG: hypothetical protein A4E57_04029 [Syntrophorhabdaceae bacterium PtaU1.Bin034]
METTADFVSDCMACMVTPISFVAPAVRSASFLTSSATTANPLPCSPARAASIAAFNASRFVWSAMSFIMAAISPIWFDRSPRFLMMPADSFTLSPIFAIAATIPWMMFSPVWADRLTISELPAATEQLRAISFEVEAISSLAVATELTSATMASAPWVICFAVASRVFDANKIFLLLSKILPIESQRASINALKLFPIFPNSS